MWTFNGIRVVTAIINGELKYSRFETNERDGKCIGVRLVREYA